MANSATQGLFIGPKNRLASRAAFYEVLSRLSCGKGSKEESEKKPAKDARKAA